MKKPMSGPNSKEIEFFSRIATVRGDSTGLGDFSMEYLQDHSGQPVADESFIQFTSQSKNQMYSLLDAALFRESGDPLRFSYPADHALTAEFEVGMTQLLWENSGQGEYLSPTHT